MGAQVSILLTDSFCDFTDSDGLSIGNILVENPVIFNLAAFLWNLESGVEDTVQWDWVAWDQHFKKLFGLLIFISEGQKPLVRC